MSAAADRIEVRRGARLGGDRPHDLLLDGEWWLAATPFEADLFDELIAAARQAPAPLPEGMEHTVHALGADILRHGWEWRYGTEDGWPRHDWNPAPGMRYECRPPQPEPQMVAVMLPADVARALADGDADDLDVFITGEAVRSAAKAALTEGEAS